MESKLVVALIGCLFAEDGSAQAVAAKQESINLDWMGGAKYFRFTEGARLKVTNLNCPSRATVSVTCRTATRARCGSWYLGLNETATAGSQSERGIASLTYNGPAGSYCTATIVVENP